MSESNIERLTKGVPDHPNIEPITELVNPASALAKSVTNAGEGGVVTKEMVGQAGNVTDILNDLPLTDK